MTTIKARPLLSGAINVLLATLAALIILGGVASCDRAYADDSFDMERLVQKLNDHVASAPRAPVDSPSFENIGPEVDPFAIGAPGLLLVYSDPGGDIFLYMRKYNELRVTGGHLRVEGVCASACTFFLGLVPLERVCASPFAYFGFRGIYRGSDFDAAYVKTWHPRVYPEKVRTMLARRGFHETNDVDRSLHPDGIIWLSAKELELQPCPV